MNPLRVEPDHLVVVAPDLRQGCDWVEERLGVRPQPGGKHVAMGTHNALLSLGRALLSRSDRGRSRRASSAAPAALVRPRRAADARRAGRRTAPRALGRAHRRHRRRRGARSRPRHADADVARRPHLAHHDSRRRPSSGPRARADAHPVAGRAASRPIAWPIRAAGWSRSPASIRSPRRCARELATLGLSDTMKVTYGKSPRIAAMIRTSRGVATL